MFTSLSRRAHSGLLLASVLLACSNGFAATAPDCPSAGHPLAALHQAKAQGWALADAGDRQSLALGLLACLSHPDPNLRDGLAFEGLSTLLRNKQLTVATRLTVYQTQLAQLQVRENDPAGFAQPFAALVLAEIVRADRLQPFLDPVQRVALVDTATSYVRGITDYRGFSSTEGWRHGVAHGADLLMQLALNPAVSGSELDAIVQAARTQVAPAQTHFYIYGESDRLARPMVHAARRGLLDAAYWQRCLDALASPLPLANWGDAFASQHGLARLHNTKQFLRALDSLVAQQKDPAVAALLAQPVAQALARLP